MNVRLVLFSKIVAALLVLSLAAPFAPAQQETGYREKIKVRVLNIEAVVTDRDGVRMPGLDVSRFRLLVDGEEVPIEYFSEVREGSAVESDQAVPGIIASEPVGVSFLVFIDNMFAIKADRDQVLRALVGRVPNGGIIQKAKVFRVLSRDSECK